jgi:hypothetical protein
VTEGRQAGEQDIAEQISDAANTLADILTDMFSEVGDREDSFNDLVAANDARVQGVEDLKVEILDKI